MRRVPPPARRSRPVEPPQEEPAVWIRLPIPPEVVEAAQHHVGVAADLADEVVELRERGGGLREVGGFLGRFAAAVAGVDEDVRRLATGQGRRRRRR